MSLLADCETWLFGQLEDHAGETVTYHRGTAKITVTGAVRENDEITETEPIRNNRVAELHRLDWVIELAQLASLTGTPDDWIEDAAGAHWTVQRVVGDQAWDYADPSRTHAIVHTIEQAYHV